MTNHSNQLRRLPSLKLNDNNKWDLDEDHRDVTESISTPQATKLFVFLRDAESVKNAYFKYSHHQLIDSILSVSAMNFADTYNDYGVPSLPTDLLLEEGVRMLLVLISENMNYFQCPVVDSRNINCRVRALSITSHLQSLQSVAAVLTSQMHI